MKILLISLFSLISLTAASQNIFTKDYPSNENYMAFRVKEDFEGNFIISGFKDVVSVNAERPYVFKIGNTGQILDSAIYFLGEQYDWYIHDVLIDSSFYYFIGYIKDWYNPNIDPNDSLMFLLKTDYNLNPLDTHFYHVVNEHDAGLGTAKFDLSGNIIVVGHYFNQNYNLSSFIKKISKNGQFISSTINPLNYKRYFSNLMIDSNYYYIFGENGNNIWPQMIYKFDSSLNQIDTFEIPYIENRYYSPIKTSSNEYFSSGYVSSSTYPSTMNFAIIKSTIDGLLLDSLEFGVVDSTNYPAFYDALCMQNGYLYFAGSVYNGSTSPPNGNNLPSNLYIAKVDTSLNIIWEKLIGGDAYYTAMNVIGTSDGGILMLASRNDITDNLANLDVRLVKLDSNGNITWLKNIEVPKTKINIYPNPATTQITLGLGSQNQMIETLNIFTITGQKAVGLTNVNSSKTINIQELKSGVYLLEGILKSGERFVGKFVKE